MGKDKEKMIPVCEPYLTGNELKYVTDCLKTNWISSQGKYIERFERGFASYCGCLYGVTTTSGTAALHLALATLGIGKGDEVIIPTFTNVATAFAVVYTGAKPVLVDCESETYNIDAYKIREKITKETKAIIPVHLYGHPCQMDRILELAMKNNLYVVEDAAEAHGAEYKGHKCGSFSHISCFSFYGNKIITSGEGGMIITDSERFAERARGLKDLAHSPGRRFVHTDIAFNYRMTNICAAIGLAQLEKIDGLVEMRRANARIYNNQLEGTQGITLPTEKPWAKNVYWMYGIELKDSVGMDNEELARRLKEKGIDTRPFFLGMHEQPVFHRMGLFKGERCPVAERLSRRGLYLPSGLVLSQEQIKVVSEAMHDIVGG